MDRRSFLRYGLLAGAAVVSRGTTVRLLMAARGGGGFVPPVTPGSGTVFTITSPGDGAWSWFGDPRAIHVGTNSYIGYVDTSGNICMRVLADASETPGAEIVLHAALDYDDHCNPSFAVLDDGRLGAWYAQHEPISTTMLQRISVNTLASDPTLSGGFQAETTTDADMGSVSYDYPVPVLLSSESGKVRMYYRNIPFGSDYQLTQSESTDDAANWSTRDTVYRSNNASGRGYWKIIDDGVSKVHFAVTNESPNTGTTHLAHAYFDAADGLFHETDGTTITLRGSAPLDLFWFIDATPVHTSSNSWVWDIALDSSGFPRILYPTWGTEFSDHRYNVAKWNGSAWSSSEICAAGAGIDSTGVYSGGMCFDHADPDNIYASRQVSGQWEIYHYLDTGSGFTETAITSSSSAKNIRPYVVGGTVIWLTGTYTGYSAAFNMGISGYRP